MSTFDDSSFEMHDDSLNPETAERLLDGENPSPEFADLVAMVNDVRTMASATPTPAVRGALAEYVGVGLTASESSAIPPAAAAVSHDLDLTTADQPRRKSVFAEVLTFAGTVSGKLLIGGAVAAASVTGAQTAGLVDLPGLPDQPATVVVADERVAEEPMDEAPAELPLEDKADEPEVVEPKPSHDEDDDTDVWHNVELKEDKVEEEAPVEDAKAEEPKEEEKAEEPAEEPKEDKPKEEEPSEHDEVIDALLAQLILDKEAVYAAATALIEPLEAEKKPLVEALSSILGPLETARNDAKAPLYAELEITEDEQRKAEIEAELSAIYNQWVVDRDAAIAEANPAIAVIETQLTNIEIERDAEIARLLEQYHAAIDALGK